MTYVLEHWCFMTYVLEHWWFMTFVMSRVDRFMTYVLDIERHPENSDTLALLPDIGKDGVVWDHLLVQVWGNFA